ncbi:MAG: VWA domain-containing protein, partial [Vicinamibacterales bacterium]
MKPSLLLAAAFAALAAALVAAQQPEPQTSDAPPVTFRVEVNYVEVDAIVTDAQGNLVRDLTRDDFELLEDRRAQTITAFSLVDIPLEREERPLFASMPIEPDVQTNTTGEGRLYLIVLDTLHTAPSNVPRVKSAVRQFIERSFGENDVAAVVFTGGQTSDSQDFTNNRRLLLAAVDRMIGMKSPGATLSRIEQMSPARQQGDPATDPFEFERAYYARNAMEHIRALSNFMASVRGRRKAMLLVGEGVEYDFTDILGSNQATGVLETVRDAIGAATRANVAIYAVDPRGLTNPDADLIVSSSSPGADDPSLGDLGARSIAREFRQSQESLRMMAEDTGGFAVLNQNDFQSAFTRIVRDNSSYYVLGYYPTNDRRDGRFRGISVRVKRPGLTVRARRGYVAPRGRPAGAAPTPVNPLSAAVGEAMASPLPVPGIPMRLFAGAIKGEAPNATVALSLELGVQGFSFAEANGTFNDRLEVRFTATNTLGKQIGSGAHTVNVALKPETFARVRTRGLRVLAQMDLPPGRYQVRMAAAESGAGKSGSVIADVEVPDFYKQPLAMSSLALTTTSAGETPTVKPNDPLAALLPGPVTATREFDRADALSVFAEFYENQRNAPAHVINIETTLRAPENGRI